MEPMHDIFISHSHRDEQPVRGLARRLREWGFDVYVDFDDATLKKPADRELAGRLKERIARCRILLFAFSSASANSKWMPWELGLAHGVVGRVVLWPLDDRAKWTPRTQEYLSLYDVLDPESAKESLEKLVADARGAAVAPAHIEAMENLAAVTAVNAPRLNQPDVFTEFVVKGPAQLYMAWLNALMGKR